RGEYLGVVPRPGVVYQVRPGRQCPTGHVAAPAVHRQERVGVSRPHGFHERDDTTGLLPGVHRVPRAGLDPTDVEDVGAVGDGLVDPAHRRVIGERGSTVVEGV